MPAVGLRLGETLRSIAVGASATDAAASASRRVGPVAGVGIAAARRTIPAPSRCIAEPLRIGGRGATDNGSHRRARTNSDRAQHGAPADTLGGNVGIGKSSPLAVQCFFVVRFHVKFSKGEVATYRVRIVNLRMRTNQKWH